MNSETALVKKLQNVLKLNGFNIRRELCCLVLEKLAKHKVSVSQSAEFNNVVHNICQSFERQCSGEESIEIEHVETALNKFLYYGYDDEESIFEIIDAFKIPKMKFDVEKKVFVPDTKYQTHFIGDPVKKAELFLNRYQVIKIHVSKAFQNCTSKKVLQTVDYLVTYHSSDIDLEMMGVFILGSLLQLSENRYAIEDPTGILKLDLNKANYETGFYVENMFVLVTGYYEDKILYVKQVLLPPSESYDDSKVNLANINYFGGKSGVCLRQSHKLDALIQQPECVNEMFLFFADFRLDQPVTLEKLKEIFEGFQQSPPYAFVFMGSFLTTSTLTDSSETNIYSLKKYLKLFAEVVYGFRVIAAKSHFIFVPSIEDPCAGHTLPRRSIPDILTAEFCRALPNAHFVSNPCRLQFCNREIVIMRLDLLNKLRFGSLSMPKRDEISEAVVKTITSQAHLCPVSIAVQSVYWNYDYTLNLSPLPDLVVIGDRLCPYNSENKGCRLINPGSFLENNFTFLSYTPSSNTVDECSV